MSYFSAAMALCDLTGVEPSLLLHPLDFLGCDDDSDLAFFPAMQSPASSKLRLAGQVLDRFQRGRTVVTLREHAAKYAASRRVIEHPSDGIATSHEHDIGRRAAVAAGR